MSFNFDLLKETLESLSNQLSTLKHTKPEEKKQVLEMLQKIVGEIKVDSQYLETGKGGRGGRGGRNNERESRSNKKDNSERKGRGASVKRNGKTAFPVDSQTAFNLLEKQQDNLLNLFKHHLGEQFKDLKNCTTFLELCHVSVHIGCKVPMDKLKKENSNWKDHIAKCVAGNKLKGYENNTFSFTYYIKVLLGRKGIFAELWTELRNKGDLDFLKNEIEKK